MSSTANPRADESIFQWFFRSEVSGSIVLLACTVAALVWANSPWADTYDALGHTCIGVSWGEHVFKMSLGHWIGDGLMVVFFFVVGLEIKRELFVGQLSTIKKAVLPVSAALGGMMAPALIYIGIISTFDGATGSARGWGVPMATDIAFALGILSLFGKRVPIGLKVFLAALAIADDLGAVLVIALFYTEQIVWGGLIAAGVFMALIVAASRFGVRRMGTYILLIMGVWIGVLVSGVHATVAGVLVAMLVPVRGLIDPKEYLTRTRRDLDELETAGLTRESMLIDHHQMEVLDDIYIATENMRPAGISLEHYLHPVQSFLILPLFALFKAGVHINAESVGALMNPVTLGIIAGLVAGKLIGVSLFTWLPIKLGLADKPAGVTWPQLWGVSCLAGVGFTMSIFVSELAFRGDYAFMIADAKLGVLAASLIAGVMGYCVLSMAFPKSSQA